MVLDRAVVERRLMELDRVLAELRSQEEQPPEIDELESDLSRRWRLERGLLAAANLILDVANHVTAGHFAVHAGTYEQSLRELASRGVLKEQTYKGFQGLGGFRNVLAHEYLEIDVEEVVRWRGRILDGIPLFISELVQWLDTVEDAEEEV